jgi:hypothetical protein
MRDTLKKCRIMRCNDRRNTISEISMLASGALTDPTFFSDNADTNSPEEGDSTRKSVRSVSRQWARVYLLPTRSWPEPGSDPSPTVAADAASGFAVNLLLGWLSGFAIAAF